MCLSGHTGKNMMCLFTRYVMIIRNWHKMPVVNEINVVLKFLDFDTKIQYFIFRQYLCIVVLNWVTFILYSSFIIPLECCFSWHTSWKRCCVCLHMTSRFYEIDIGFIVVHEIRCYFEIIDLGTEIQYFIS